MTATRKTVKANADRQISNLVTTTRSLQTPAQTTKPVEMTVSMGDLKAMAISMLRARLLKTREEAKASMDEASAAHEQAVRVLQREADMLVAAHLLDPAIVEFANQVGKWVGETVVVFFDNADNYSYRDNEEEKRKKQKPTVDIDSKTVSAKLRLCIRHSHGNILTHIEKLDRSEHLPFTPAMLLAVARIEETKQHHDQTVADLTAVNRQIAAMPHRGDDIQSALTRAHLTGRLTDTANIVAIIEESVERLALPASTMKALPQSKE